MPPPSDEVYARESREFLDDLESFLVAECEGRHGADPVGFEVAFGVPADEAEGEPLASATPLVLDAGRQAAARSCTAGSIASTASAPASTRWWTTRPAATGLRDWKGEFAGGTRLQHALYGAAAAPLLKPIDAEGPRHRAGDTCSRP